MTLTDVLESPLLLPKDTIHLRVGSYADVPYLLNKPGNAGGNVTIQPYQNDRSIIAGSLNIAAAYQHLKNVEICKPTYDPRSTDVGTCDETSWIDVDDKGNVMISGAYIHDLSYGILCKGNNLEINGCVIRATGWDAPGSYLAGHGIYFTNPTAGTKITIKNCILCDSFGFLLHGYSDGVDLHSAEIIGNICFNAGNLNTWGGRRTNIMLGSVGAAWPRGGKVIGNCSYFPDFTGGIGIHVGVGAGGSTDIEITDNISAGGVYAMANRNPTNPTVTGNTIIGDTLYFEPEDYPDNTYLADFPATGSIVKVFPLDYHTDRAHVAVYNWALVDSIEIDLTDVTGLSAGDTVTVANAQDLRNDIQTVVLDAGKKITVDMQAANRTVQAPINWTAPETTFPRFGAFVVEKV
jgi:hypothetical protein